ncbi:S41 family peptidase [Porticoccaceae bacterium LTM1]|nr:S41 family peptidase [Porticoccaceae bacterium LTM1]
MSIRKPCWLSALPIALLLNASVLQANEPAPEVPDNARLPLEELRLFTQVFEQIRQTYVEPIDDKTLLEHAIAGLLTGLDPHSVYLDEQAFANLQENTNGEFSGIGIEVDMEDDQVLVIAPIDNSPAKKAGIKAGDRIIKIDEHLVKGMTQAQAIERMRGPIGSMVSLTILRSGETAPLEIKLARGTIKTNSVSSRVLEPGYGYIRISQFQLDTGTQFRNNLISLMHTEKPLKGLLLDLRNNPGGLLPAAIDVADTLLDGGIVTYTKGRLSSSNHEYAASPGDITSNIPIVVIINGGSASASEIVAGALQDHQRAVILGTQSFGKGSVQTVMPISETQAIKLTTARYFTPAGRSIQAQGIKPDILVERAQITAVEPSFGIREENLIGHLENGDPSSANTPSKLDFSADNQLFEGLNVLKGAHILSRKETKADQIGDLGHKIN